MHRIPATSKNLTHHVLSYKLDVRSRLGEVGIDPLVVIPRCQFFRGYSVPKGNTKASRFGAVAV